MRLKEFSHAHRSIYFVDIDETLFKTAAKIRVVKDGKTVGNLTNQEYNSHELAPGEEYDYAEFADGDLFRTTSEPIDNVIEKVKEIHAKVVAESGSRIILLTARADFLDKEPFLQKFRDHGLDIDNMYVERTGNMGHGPSGPKKKIKVAEYLNSGDYDRAKMVDDHHGNLDAFLSLQSDFPEVEFRAWYVDESGNTTLYK